MLSEKVGRNLRKMRLINNLSKEKVELDIGISHRTYSLIENAKGRIDLNRLEAFASYYNTDVFSILTFGDQNTQVNEPSSSYSKADVELAKCKEQIASLKAEIKNYETKLKMSEASLKDKNMIIDLLKKKS
jgi:transcriptional regulator with XRE-family HTH domain